ncbi:MAG: hypothetical protein SNJ67_02535 [Chloracidobacterium sp.]|uniref:DUF4388 domain-containing protein n=1 Tax=Chloracidobacterium validum TaxID=2821543 RepID=A0ABX8B6A8_9BACT|nr:hypothetical protein [Chloracidobacterium validum]QUW02161.1 hypothetical protein J8C06_07250 [Chloracidobacterium validum]
MIVPRGKPVHENLSTSYVNVAALLADLQVNEFTGYVSVEFWGYSSYVFLSRGQIVNAYEATDSVIQREREALDGLLSRAQARNGKVGFFHHPEEVIHAIAGIINGEPVYRDLSSDFTNLEKLVEKLVKSDSVWYVEVLFEQEPSGGIIYIVDGRAEGVCSVEFGGEGQYQVALGSDGLKLIYERVSKGATFNVYRGTAAPDTLVTTIKPPATAQPRLESVSVGAAPVEQVGALKPTEEMPPPTVRVPEVQLPPPTSPVVDMALVGDADDGDSPLELEDESTRPLTREQYAELVGLMGEVVSAVEAGVTDALRRADFLPSFREALINIATHYPFLDPFAAEFEYAGGVATFRGKARPADFVVGLAQALRLTVADLDRRAPETHVRSHIETALRALHQRRRSEFERYGLEIATNEILAPSAG